LKRMGPPNTRSELCSLLKSTSTRPDAGIRQTGENRDLAIVVSGIH
jgi:hypothetical protein